MLFLSCFILSLSIACNCSFSTEIDTNELYSDRLVAAADDVNDDDGDNDLAMNIVVYRRMWMKGHLCLESSTS